MTKTRYAAVAQEGYLEGLGSYRTYGLQALTASGEGWIVSREIADVSTDGVLMADLAERCTRGELALCQMMDVVWDAIG